jgi:CheY-like chemotaxis protein
MRIHAQTEVIMAKVKQKSKTKILLVDDHPLVRKSLAEIISREPEFGGCRQDAAGSHSLERLQRRLLSPGVGESQADKISGWRVAEESPG